MTTAIFFIGFFDRGNCEEYWDLKGRWLTKYHETDSDCSDKADNIREEADLERITAVTNANSSEIYGQHVKGSIGAALDG